MHLTISRARLGFIEVRGWMMVPAKSRIEVKNVECLNANPFVAGVFITLHPEGKPDYAPLVRQEITFELPDPHPRKKLLDVMTMNHGQVTIHTVESLSAQLSMPNYGSCYRN